MIVLIQLFWLSFIVIGIAILHALAYSNRVTIPPKLKLWSKELLSFNELIVAVIGMCTGFAVFIPLISVGYVSRLPTALIGLLYAPLLLLSFVYLYNARLALLRRVKAFWVSNRSIRWIIVLAGISLLVEYILNVIVGGSIRGDSAIHVSRINIMVNDTMTLVDPYFGQNGVIDVRYSTNIISALMAFLATVTGVSALDVWTQSAAFYRSMIWLSIFSALWVFLPRNVQRYWGYGVLTLMPLVYWRFFIGQQASMPDRAVWIWTAMLIIGVLLYVRKGNPILMLMAGALIAVTHALSSLIALGFMVFIAVLLFVLRRWTVRQLLAPMLTVLLLILPVIPVLYFPDYTKLSEQAFNAAVLNGSGVRYSSFGWLTWHKVEIPLAFTSFIGLLVLGLYTLIIRRTHVRALRYSMVVLWVAASLLLINPTTLACMGYLFILPKIRSWYRFILIAVMVFYAAVIYNPLIISFVHAKVPPWLIGRFQELNILSMAMPIVGVFVYVLLILWLLKLSPSKGRVQLLSYCSVVILLFIPWMSITAGKVNFPNHFWRETVSIRKPLEIPHAILPFSEQTKNTVVFAADEDDQYMIPAVSKANVVATAFVNSSPMANPIPRRLCQDRLTEQLALNDLSAIKVSYVIVRIDSYFDRDFNTLAATRPYLQQVDSNKLMRLYKVVYPDNYATDAKSVCAIPYKQ